jgi:hypothetical protein
VDRIRRVRRASRWLVTIGACATAGGIQALRNFTTLREVAGAVYPKHELLTVLNTSTPVSEHVITRVIGVGNENRGDDAAGLLAARELRGSATRTPGTSKRSSASNCANSFRIASAESGMKPRPRHSKCGRRRKTRRITSSAPRLPSSRTTRRYWFSISQRLSHTWRTIMCAPCRMSSGSKPTTTTGLP